MTNLSSILDTTAERMPEAAAIVFEGTTTSYASLARSAHGVAADLAAKGVSKGDRVAVWLPNHPAFASVMYGVLRLGAVVVPVHAALTKPEARHILADAGVKAVFMGSAQAAAGGDELVGELGLHGVVVKDAFDTATDEAPMTAEVDDSDLAVIAYTSGTSGLPKGAMLTHANLSANLDQMSRTPIAVGPEDAVLCVLPLFHIFGLNVVLNLAVKVGAKVVLHERFDPRGSMDAVREHGITVVAGAPPVYVAWLSVPDAPSDAFANVRIAVSGAAPLPPTVLAAFGDRFGVTIWEGYGLTETSPALTFTGIGGVAKPGSIGRALDGVDIRLVDEAGDDVEPGDPGEIVVRGPNVFAGYWNQPEYTQQAFVDGWFRTGDVGVADDDGDLFLVDRRRDLIIVSGFNVYPREVEDVLRRHPKVGDCAVVGDDDERTGEHVRAIVVADPPGESVDPQELIEFCGRSLAPYKVPSIVEIVPEIPRNAAGKVLRRVLRS
ncbi:MAG TPA: AMP-binding protein [Actinomycetota bacterium]|jgi:long-chain acyl-CoA synthetase|nr:AMP-binding protein [Actinomycetota bacterium]